MRVAVECTACEGAEVDEPVAPLGVDAAPKCHLAVDGTLCGVVVTLVFRDHGMARAIEWVAAGETAFPDDVAVVVCYATEAARGPQHPSTLLGPYFRIRELKAVAGCWAMASMVRGALSV